jgi:hypothetical protein
MENEMMTMMSTRKTAFNIRVSGIESGGKMREIKLMLSVFVLALVMLTSIGASQDSWNLGSSEDWLSTGPVYHFGPFYYPNSDLSLGMQRFLNTYLATCHSVIRIIISPTILRF